MAQTSDGTVTWTAMSEGSQSDYQMLSERYEDHASATLTASLLATPFPLGHELNLQPSTPGPEPR